MTPCGPYAICGSPWVDINSAYGVSANSTNLAIGSAAAHELGHWLGLNNGIWAHEPLSSGNLMARDLGTGGAYRPNDPASAIKLNPAQIAQALKKCIRWPSASSGGGGGGPADPTHGGGGAASGGSGSGSTWFNLYYSWLLLQPTEVVTWHFVF